MNLNDLYPAVLIIVTIGILLGIGLFTMAEVRTNIATDYTGTDAGLNLTDEAGTTTLADSTKDDYVLSAVAVTNGSTVTIPATYYSFTSAGVITWTEALYNGSTAYYATNNNGTTVTSTYTYDKANSAEAAVGDSIDGVLGFSSWIAVIVIVLAAAVVLGIVMRSFGQNSKV